MNVDSALISAYAFYGTILLAKMWALSFWTAKKRFATNTFISPEDIKGRDGAKVGSGSPDVERVRRAHQNDIENIYLFLIIAAFYLVTEPSVGTALTLFRVFTGARIIHTLSYLNELQPWRALAFMVGQGVVGFMMYSTLCALW